MQERRARRIAVAIGAVAVPDLAGTVSDGTETLGAWVYLAVLILILLLTSTLVGFVIHGDSSFSWPASQPNAVTSRSRSVAGSSDMSLQRLLRIGIVSALAWTGARLG